MAGRVMAMLEGIDRPSQVTRIGERLGMYDRHRIDPEAPSTTASTNGGMRRKAERHRPKREYRSGRSSHATVTVDGSWRKFPRNNIGRYLASVCSSLDLGSDLSLMHR